MTRPNVRNNDVNEYHCPQQLFVDCTNHNSFKRGKLCCKSVCLLECFFVDPNYLFVKLLRELSCTKNVLKVRVLFNLVLRGSRIFNREADLGSVGD